MPSTAHNETTKHIPAQAENKGAYREANTQMHTHMYILPKGCVHIFKLQSLKL